MKKFTDKIKKMWDKEPEKVIGMGVVIILVSIKVVKAYDDHKRGVIWDREVDRRRAVAGMQ